MKPTLLSNPPVCAGTNRLPVLEAPREQPSTLHRMNVLSRGGNILEWRPRPRPTATPAEATSSAFPLPGLYSPRHDQLRHRHPSHLGPLPSRTHEALRGAHQTERTVPMRDAHRCISKREILVLVPLLNVSLELIRRRQSPSTLMADSDSSPPRFRVHF